MENKKEVSPNLILAKINIGIFLLVVLPAILYVTHIALSSKIWSAKLPACFLVILSWPLVVLAAIGAILSITGVICFDKNSIISFVTHCLLLIIYILLASGKLIDFLIH